LIILIAQLLPVVILAGVEEGRQEENVSGVNRGEDCAILKG
jgi:hypothetical protein